MRPKRFIEALKGVDLPEVLDRRDQGRVADLTAQAIDHSDKFVLVGFRVPADTVRILWAIIEVIPAGPATGDDLPPGLPPAESGYEAWDLRLDSIVFSQGPTAEIDDIDAAKPSDMRQAPAVLLPFPGRVSWEKLRQTAERLVS